MKQRSASGLARLSVCGHSLTPGIPLVDSTSDAADYGTAEHAATAKRQPAGPESTAFIAWIMANGMELGNHELGFVYDGETVQMAPPRDEYGETPDDGKFYGTVDFLWVSPERIAYVVDWKTGFQDSLSPAEENLQIQAYGWLVKAFMPQLKGVRVGWINVQPTGKVRESWYDMTDFDHAAVKATIDAIKVTAPNPGSQCTWCPARLSCPATAAALALIGAGQLSVNNLPAIWNQVKAAEDLLKKIKDATKAHVEANGPLLMPNGKRLKLVDMKGRRTVGVDELKAHLGDAEFAVLEQKGIVKQCDGYSYLREVK